VRQDTSGINYEIGWMRDTFPGDPAKDISKLQGKEYNDVSKKSGVEKGTLIYLRMNEIKSRESRLSRK